MKTSIIGNAHVFGKNIDTDQIYPGRYLELVDPKEIACHCLEGADPKFVEEMQEGDIIVAATNFGCGSSREHAPITLIHAGVSLVIAESFARIFYRNALNLALPLIVCKDIHSKVSRGDKLEVNRGEGIIKNLTTGQVIKGEKLSGYALEILEAGGIKPLMREKFGEKV